MKKHLFFSKRANLVGLALVLIALIALPAAADTLAAYNPRYDVNSDGEINITDITMVASAWGTSGSPNDNELIVSATGGEFETITAALASITDNGPANPYVVKVLPGVYAEQVELKPYVHLMGSGTEVTIISHDVSSSTSFTETAVIRGSANAQVSDLTVQHTGAGDINVGIHTDAGDFKLDNVQVTMLNGADCYGIFVQDAIDVSIHRADVSSTCSANNKGIYNSSSTVKITDSDVMVKFGTEENHALENGNSTVVIRDSDLYGGDPGKLRPQDLQFYAVFNSSSVAKINGGLLYGTTASIFTLSDSTSRISGAELVNGKDAAGTGTYTCVGVFDSSYAALNATCD